MYKDDDKLYKMIKHFENNVRERLIIDENKEILNYKMNNYYLNNNIINNANVNVNNNNLLKNNFKPIGEVELIPKKYICRCTKIIYPEIDSEKLKERERLLFGKK